MCCKPNALAILFALTSVISQYKSEQAMDSLQNDKPGEGVGTEKIGVGDSDAGEV
jgi:hypothetical protein